MEIDKNGLIWVAETGTGKNDGKVSVIYPDGKKADVIVNFESLISDGGEATGPSHLLFDDGLLYILGASGKMYKAVASSLKPGSTIVQASSLGVENIGAYVLAQKPVTNDSHPYNFTLGPNGTIYITDAGANAIVKREKNGVLSIVAQLPNIPNPTPVGAPVVEAVPTGIYYDGENFLITTLRGFPFPAGKATIYKMTPAGILSEYQTGFTTLVDIAKGNSNGKLVVSHGSFSLTTFSFTPFSGNLSWATGSTSTVFVDKIDEPGGLKQEDDHTWYVTSFTGNSVIKVTYK